MCPFLEDGLERPLVLVAAEIIKDHHITLFQGWGEDLLDMERKPLSVDRPVDDPWRACVVVAQGGNEGLRFPVAIGSVGYQALSFWSPSPKGSHVGLDPGLIDEDQPFKIETTLIPFPAFAFAGDVRTVLLRRVQCFL